MLLVSCWCVRLNASSQHPKTVQTPEHATVHRVQLISRQVQFVDGRRALERPVLDLGNLIVAEVSVGHMTASEKHQQQRGTSFVGPGAEVLLKKSLTGMFCQDHQRCSSRRSSKLKNASYIFLR